MTQGVGNGFAGIFVEHDLNARIQRIDLAMYLIGGLNAGIAARLFQQAIQGKRTLKLRSIVDLSERSAHIIHAGGQLIADLAHHAHPRIG
ncbi:hypothetical protein D3C73_1467330 [compost metagenome]